MAVVTGAGAGLHAAGQGATLLQLRDPGASDRALEAELAQLVAEAPIPVLVSGRADLALAAGAAGVHLPEAGLAVAQARRLLPLGLVGRSVHSVAAARQAEAEGADYVVFGPVFESASHPGAAATGLEALAEVARAVALPVLAIGGVDPERAAACRAAGAAGFAGIGYYRAGRIALRINGKPVELAAEGPLLGYLAGLGVDPRAVAVEVNGEILARAAYAACTLRAGDVVEIVRMVGGGRLRPGPAPGSQPPPRPARPTAGGRRR